jgi:1-acyl-sn-glycerol-3-phosphate acyltransferase
MRLRRLLAEACYAAWWWFALGCGLALGAPAVLLLPSLPWRWAAVRGLARAVLAATGIRPAAEGAIPRAGALLMVNHASYADALVLAAILPGEPVYVAKREFAEQRLVGALLRRLDALFVDRLDLAGGQRDIDRLVAAAREGRLLVVFPEGTFTRRPGLSEFFLGAFKVAAEANVPVVPAALRGTRSLLRAGQWFPRRTPVSLTVGEPIMPTGTDLASVVRLREAVRAAILSRCGEPDLAELVKPQP